MQALIFWDQYVSWIFLKHLVISHFLITCYSCHIRLDSAFEKANKTEVSWFIFYVISATGNILWLAGERSGSTCTHLCLLATALQGTVGSLLGWSVILETKRTDRLDCTRLCTGELLSQLLLI